MKKASTATPSEPDEILPEYRFDYLKANPTARVEMLYPFFFDAVRLGWPRPASSGLHAPSVADDNASN